MIIVYFQFCILIFLLLIFFFLNNRIKFITSIIFINKNGKTSMLVSVLKLVKFSNILIAFWHKDVLEFLIDFVYYQGHPNHIKNSAPTIKKNTLINK